MTAQAPGGPDGRPGTPPAVDSHGVAWAGRTLTPQPFAGDDGSADPVLAPALVARAAGRADEAEVMAALMPARVLVPVVATSGEGAPLPDHVRGDAGADMALPLLAGPDGARALPLFTSTAALAAWDAVARPVPVEAARAALSAVDEGCACLVVDPGSPQAFVVRRPPLWALAQGRPWVPPHQDREVVAAVRAALSATPGLNPSGPDSPAVPGLPSVPESPESAESAGPVRLAGLLGVRCEPGRNAELAVVLELAPGLDAVALSTLLTEAGRLLADVPLLAERADSLELRPVPA